MDELRKLSVSELREALQEHLSPDTLQLLQDQCVSGSVFVELSREEMCLYKFPLGHMIEITRVQRLLREGKVAILSLADKENNDDTDSDSLDVARVDRLLPLLPHFSKETLQLCTDYEIEGMLGRVKNHEALTKAGLTRGKLELVLPQAVVDETASLERSTMSQERASTSRQKQTTLFKITAASSVIPAEDDSEDEDEAEYEPSRAGKKKRQETAYKPKTLPLTVEQIKAIDPHLISFDVKAIISEDDKAKKCLPALNAGFRPASIERKLIIRTLVRHLRTKHVNHINDVSGAMKEAMAKSICVGFPQFQNLIVVEGKKPWSSFYDKSRNVGFIANVSKRVQTSLPEAQRKRAKQTRKPRKKQNPSACSVNIEALALMMPGRAEHEDILNQMLLSLPMRSDERSAGASITEMLKKYPHFMSYNGELISQEFKGMCPNAKDFCLQMGPLISKIIETAEIEFSTKCQDDTVKALMVLGSKLPHPICASLEEEEGGENLAVRPPVRLPVEEELIVVINIGVDIDSSIQDKRELYGGPVQPYLLAVRGQLCQNIIKVFLVADNRAIELGRIPMLRALDILFKAYVAFNVHYPQSWQNVFRFLQTCIYQVFFSDGDAVPPSAQELYGMLINL